MPCRKKVSDSVSFLTPGFFLFFPVVALVWFLLPGSGRRIWLLLASWWFCLCAGVEHLAFLLGATALTYAGARLLDRCPGGRRKIVLAVLLLSVFGTLFVFKYLDFALRLLDRIFAATGLAFSSPGLSLILPVGISFYGFMAAGYLIDVYRRERRAETSFLDLALFLSFFPALLSGPISRAGDLIPQLRRPAPFSWDALRSGSVRFLWGAFKKLVVADRLGILVSTVYAAADDFGRLAVWTAAFAFSIQIYCDFSAYSDMALGCAQAMGLRLTENFRTPYFSRSIGEFWRRWHISLSSWFRDYLYIPMGGSRKGRRRKDWNVLVVFAVSGLWHGAALTFLVWGLVNAFYQIIGGRTLEIRKKLRRRLGLREEAPLTAALQVSLTFLCSTAAWVFFKGGSFTHSLAIFRAMFTGPWLIRPVSAWGLDPAELTAALFAVLLVAAVECLSVRMGSFREKLLSLPRPARWAGILMLLAAVLIFGVYGTGYDPQDFIYFKF